MEEYKNVFCFTAFEVFSEVLTGMFYFYKRMALFDGVKTTCNKSGFVKPLVRHKLDWHPQSLFF